MKNYGTNYETKQEILLGKQLINQARKIYMRNKFNWYDFRLKKTLELRNMKIVVREAFNEEKYYSQVSLGECLYIL